MGNERAADAVVEYLADDGHICDDHSGASGTQVIPSSSSLKPTRGLCFGSMDCYV
jgi:hypothetical protein